MYWFLFLLLLPAAALIFYQDLSSRAVLWYLFPITGILGLINSYMHTGSWKQTLIHSAFNAGFILLQFALLKLYFRLKDKGQSRLINEKIGMGDLLFLLAVCFYFSPFNFLLFYFGSLLFSMIFHLLFATTAKKTKRTLTVPLAGYMAVFLVLYIFSFQVTKSDVTHDEWILNYLM